MCNLYRRYLSVVSVQFRRVAGHVSPRRDLQGLIDIVDLLKLPSPASICDASRKSICPRTRGMLYRERFGLLVSSNISHWYCAFILLEAPSLQTPFFITSFSHLISHRPFDIIAFPSFQAFLLFVRAGHPLHRPA